MRWEREEILHYRWFEVAYGAAFGERLEALQCGLAGRSANVNFEPLAGLLSDEFSALGLVAYDELATVGAFRVARDLYSKLGPGMLRIVDEVTRDEGRHYAAFLAVLKERHAARLAEVPQVLARIRAIEGLSYANSFVLDHEGDLWSESLFERAESTLLRSLGVRAQ